MKARNDRKRHALVRSRLRCRCLLVIALVTVVTLYPFLNVLAISLNDSTDSVRGGITIFPRQFTLKNYETIFAFSGLHYRA